MMIRSLQEKKGEREREREEEVKENVEKWVRCAFICLM